MKYAWIENNHVRDIAPGNPAEFYTPEVAAHYTTEVADDIMRGARLVDGNWVNLEVPVNIATPIRLISANNVRSNLTLAERAKWDNDTTPEIKTAKIEFSASITSTAATEVLGFLVQTQNISQASADKILGTTS